jgi:hypothetical protein
MPSTQPLSHEQLIRTRIAVLRRDRERKVIGHRQALAAIDHFIEELEQRLAQSTTTNATNTPPHDATGLDL